MGIGTSKTERTECRKGDDTLRFGCGQDVGRKTSMEDASWAQVLAVTAERGDAIERSPSIRGFFVVPLRSSSGMNLHVNALSARCAMDTEAPMRPILPVRISSSTSS